MAIQINDQSTLTDRYQTTIPSSIRRALNLQARDRIQYHVLDSGDVVLKRAETKEEPDPVVCQFLAFLEADMSQQPQNLQALTTETFAEARTLTQGVEIDLDAPLEDDDTL